MKETEVAEAVAGVDCVGAEIGPSEGAEAGTDGIAEIGSGGIIGKFAPFALVSGSRVYVKK